MSNRAEGINSHDAEIAGSIVEFVNKSSTPYPTDVGAPAFDLVDVRHQKDIMLNVARMHGEQEYKRITEVAQFVKQQADLVHERNPGVVSKDLVTVDPMYQSVIDMARVLMKQANSVARRIEITDAVHASTYSFTPAHSGIYWLVYDTHEDLWRLSIMGPSSWSAGPPEHYKFYARVKWLGDYTWIEVDEFGVPLEDNP